ncbi:hypothetical protein Golob_022231 [Gossypium lobatum]|uniref:Uncharacterized protein n=1 Tax=Gossypium lobatum TaxID=34289 RepID=A0A7J8LG88_9ROSI|nr:hypothetical protein [Gossypium lobatum]
MLGSYPSPYMYPNPYMFPFHSPMPGGITRGTFGELISFPIPITLWDSNTSAVDDANTSAFFILSRWVILLTPPTRTTTTSVKATTIPAES